MKYMKKPQSWKKTKTYKFAIKNLKQQKSKEKVYKDETWNLIWIHCAVVQLCFQSTAFCRNLCLVLLTYCHLVEIESKVKSMPKCLLCHLLPNITWQSFFFLGIRLQDKETYFHSFFGKPIYWQCVQINRLFTNMSSSILECY